MTNMDRRHLLRMAAPAVALPMVASVPALAKEERLVSKDEIMAAFRFYDGMELCAEDLNLRYQLLIEMLFETNPAELRKKLQTLADLRKKRSVIVDAFSGEAAPFDPSMYDEKGQRKRSPYESYPAPETTPTGPHIAKKLNRLRKINKIRKLVGL